MIGSTNCCNEDSTESSTYAYTSHYLVNLWIAPTVNIVVRVLLRTGVVCVPIGLDLALSVHCNVFTTGYWVQCVKRIVLTLSDMALLEGLNVMAYWLNLLNSKTTLVAHRRLFWLCHVGLIGQHSRWAVTPCFSFEFCLVKKTLHVLRKRGWRVVWFPNSAAVAERETAARHSARQMQLLWHQLPYI